MANIIRQYALTGMPPAYLPNLNPPSDHE
jgi:hypothetical protein